MSTRTTVAPASSGRAHSRVAASARPGATGLLALTLVAGLWALGGVRAAGASIEPRAAGAQPVTASGTSSSGSSAASTSASPAPDAQAQSAKERAKQLVANASGAVESAVEWLKRKGDSASVDAQAWRARAAQELNSAIDKAFDIPRQPAGVRLLAPDQSARPSPTSPVSWSALSAGEGGGALAARVVLLVHGLDEPGDLWDDIAPALQGAGHAVARFDYPNDQHIGQSARLLRDSLRELAARGVKHVDIVAHSMGGLVSRDALTSGADAGRGADAPLPSVDRLIMSGTPNQGSALARLHAIAEAREQMARWIDTPGHDPRLLLGFLTDGAGEAADDLLPDSAYLKELNARPLPSETKITLIAGVVSSGVESDLRELVRTPWVRRALGSEQAERLEGALVSAAESLGDGIVSVESTRLAGVEDRVEILANHRSMLRRPKIETALRTAVGEQPRVASALPIILDRLGREP